MAGPAKSKWLRKEGDADWEERIGRVNSIPKSGEGSFTQEGNQLFPRSNFRQSEQSIRDVSLPANMGLQIAKLLGSDVNSNSADGPEEDELVGLNLVERKRMREVPEVYDIMEIAGGIQIGTGNNTTNTHM